jgi:hypothetical protein
MVYLIYKKIEKLIYIIIIIFIMSTDNNIYHYALLIPCDEIGTDLMVCSYLDVNFAKFHFANKLMREDIRYKKLLPRHFQTIIDDKKYILIRYSYTDNDLINSKTDSLISNAGEDLHKGKVWDVTSSKKLDIS